MKNALPYAAFIAGCFALGISVMSVLGYLTTVPPFYNWGGLGSSVPMALPTAMMGLFLSIGVISISIATIERRDCTPAAMKQSPAVRTSGFATRGAIVTAAFVVMLAYCAVVSVRSGDFVLREQALADREMAVTLKAADVETMRGRYLSVLGSQKQFLLNEKERLTQVRSFLASMVTRNLP